MSSDEDDYMSDKFIVKETEDIRPGIPKRKVDQHTFEQYKKKLKSLEEKQPNKHVHETILRNEGLNTAIASDNKGFQMLAKMGYKLGNSLGSTNSGIVEPIGINLKKDKGGLGKKPKPEPGTSRKTPKIEVTKEMEQSYRQSVRERKNLMMMKHYYFGAQRSCLMLDQQNDVEIPVREYFWPRKVIDDMKLKEKTKAAKTNEDSESSEEEDPEEEIEEEVVNEEVLADIVEYLRCTYFYCIYCAAKATDEEDLSSFCPGESYEDHEMD